ncbi:hypothetical protein NDU88_000044, partial [Pleurodeles waltl]
ARSCKWLHCLTLHQRAVPWTHRCGVRRGSASGCSLTLHQRAFPWTHKCGVRRG